MIQAHGLTNAAVGRIIWDPLFSRDPFPSRSVQEEGCRGLFSSQASTYQEHNFLQESEVTIERLRSILETAVIDLEPDDEGDLYLTGGVDFPIWVHVDSDRTDRTVHVRWVDDAIYSRHIISFDGGHTFVSGEDVEHHTRV